MRKRCFVTHQFKTGGVEKLFITYANNLQEDIFLLPVNCNFDDIYNDLPDNVTVIKTPRFINSKGDVISYLLKLIFLYFELIIFRKHGKLIFINFSDTLSSLFLTYILGGNSGYSWIHLNPEVINNSKFFHLYNFIYSKMKKIICICNDQKAIFEKYFKRVNIERIEVIKNCIDAKRVNIENKLSIPDCFLDKKFILMVARIDTRSKDFITLIDAYDKLDTDIKSNYLLVILGDGSDYNLVNGIIKEKGLSENIIMIGHDSNPYRWMSKCSLFIHSSKAEGFGLVIVEAMQCGAPVIATDCNVGPREILDNGKYGVLIKVGDVNGCTEAIKHMLSNNNYENYKTKSLTRALDYNVNISIQQIKKIII